ncbi:hypothetical protein LTR70_006631 [Exophiala xenobiotica]|nr:hypothetical protein LTR70_006631 [Exophiala xenobiotica]
MASTATGKNIQYGNITITGQATALLGNRYGDIFNIQQAIFLLNAASITDNREGHCKVVRQNRVYPDAGYTIETITTFDNGRVSLTRGTSQRIELRWERCEDIGAGVFGEVHREQSRENGRLKSRAVKVLRRRQLERMRIDYKKELDALIQLSHPEYVHRFVEFLSWYENGNSIYLAMEFVPHGDLESYIQAGLEEHDARQIAYQVLDGIRIMHRLDLIHRDIKPANIFVVQQVPIWWVKIGDFSICKSTTTRQTSLNTQVGTQGYQAPEILGLVATEKSNQYNSKVDLWSFGCLVYEMLTAQLPFADVGALTRFCNDEIPFPALSLKRAAASRRMAEFVWTMLRAEPQARPTAEEAAFLFSWVCGPSTSQLYEAGENQNLYSDDSVVVPTIDKKFSELCVHGNRRVAIRLTTAESEPGSILEEPALETEAARRAFMDLGLSTKDKKEQERMKLDDTRDSRLTQDKIDKDTSQTPPKRKNFRETDSTLSQRERNLTNGRITQRVIERLRKNSRETDSTLSPSEPSLLSNSVIAAGERSDHSAVTNNSINNPRFLQTVEDAIQRLILPELKELKKDQWQRARSHLLETSVVRGRSAHRSTSGENSQRRRSSKDHTKRPGSRRRKSSHREVDYNPSSDTSSNRAEAGTP